MTEYEVKKIVNEVLKTADGGCTNCVGGLIQEFAKAFPAFSECDLVNLIDDRIGRWAPKKKEISKWLAD